MCQLPGHDHEWKDYPGNQRSKTRRVWDDKQESHATQRNPDSSQDSREIQYEISNMEEDFIMF